MNISGMIKIAWRSMWRNYRRTLITITAIALGLGLSVFSAGLAEGMYQQMISDAVRTSGGHFALEHAGYRDAASVDLYVDNVSAHRRMLNSMPEVRQVKVLILGQGVAKTGKAVAPVGIMGIEPKVERLSSPLVDRIIKGSYLHDDDKRKALIGYKLAKRLNLDVGKKMVVASSNSRGQMVEELVRVRGIFKSGSDEMDNFVIQIPLSQSRVLFDLGEDQATQLGVLLKDSALRTRVMDRYRLTPLMQNNDVVALPWEAVLPLLADYVRTDRVSNHVFLGIVIFLSLFTIFNTIIMSVMERRREFAMLMAIGTPLNNIRAQVMIESLFIGIGGILAGLSLGGIPAYWFKSHGLDLTAAYGEGLSVSGFAVDPVVFFAVDPGVLFDFGLIIFVATLTISLIAVRDVRRIRIADILR